MKNGLFSVNSLYHYMNGSITNRQRDFPSEIIWKSGAPPQNILFCLGDSQRKDSYP